ncbi:hypothetical protein SAMN02745166_04196 [Prosthecobacter debontii]|uniref:PH domain-containing protein n=1 Tax=Prosthecobacter debontii TaxID=48467 RepID=A0A1T4YTQ6_9BACT|nr:hypothetical protein [Prosthecobacter debontii]SKB05179.1 hypothetical protein SAMN02745166_04196 [Prosthecobacter debontii]
MSDNPVSAAAEELKKWLEVLEKILNKMESDKLSAAKAKLDGDRFDAMLKELKGIKEGLDKAPDGPGKDAVSKDVDKALDKLNDHGNKTGHGMGQKKGFDNKFKASDDKSQVNALGNSQQKAVKTPPIKISSGKGF